MWGNSNITKLRRLQSIQNRLLGKIYHNCPVTNDHVHYNFLKCVDIYKFFCLVKFYKFVKMEHNTKFVDLASQNTANHVYPTRFNCSHNINIPRIHSSRVFCSFFITLLNSGINCLCPQDHCRMYSYLKRKYVQNWVT